MLSVEEVMRNGSRRTWNGEIRAYTAEHHFQKASGLTVEHANEDDIRVFVWSNYKNGGR